ncbi:hypothetical protein LNAOJCKE_1044 [Methylorubrum aminovorans]|uniref:site-specific DNA-methyltransferase (cytosine-N(4)-specific) n=1 Tax=Methylorubrum aminovorans TaxID=269069 RepID=A0ABQ4UAQ4_9HYPH|nr:hypothetical protein [Methylorubrum aminovorans]GJE63846.1 hypothetical protein LNAOJCKE_1044 [Methylorubrum aminovorans]
MHTKLVAAAEAVVSPKREKKVSGDFYKVYPYYAGYSQAFAEHFLSSLDLKAGATILDPWNGSGTTTSSAVKLGFQASGFDINPTMVIVGRARLLPASEAKSLLPLAYEIQASAARERCQAPLADPLHDWFTSENADEIRSIERTIHRFLVCPTSDQAKNSLFTGFSSLASCFYMALFLVVRSAASGRKSTNPTWTKLPKSPDEKINSSNIKSSFIEALIKIADWVQRSGNAPSSAKIDWADSSSYAAAFKHDLVLTSPPYCTRIDYAASSRMELAVLEPVTSIDQHQLRRSMIGTTTVPKKVGRPSSAWGPTCNRFIQDVADHQSVASSTYYYKNHVDYFDKLYRSFGCVSDAIKPGGAAVMVIQDSYYKDLHNDVPKIAIEMMQNCGFKFVYKREFESLRCFSKLNAKSATYRDSKGSTESVICFTKDH